MRVHQFIFVGAMVVAFIVGCIKAPRKVLGGIIGGFLGLLIPFSLAAI